MKHILDALASLGLVVLPLGATIIVWILIAREIIRVMWWNNVTIATGMGSSKTGIACAIKDPCQNKTYMPDRFTINGKRLSPVLNAIKSDPLALGKWASFLQRGLGYPGRKAFKERPQGARRKAARHTKNLQALIIIYLCSTYNSLK